MSFLNKFKKTKVDSRLQERMDLIEEQKRIVEEDEFNLSESQKRALYNLGESSQITTSNSISPMI